MENRITTYRLEDLLQIFDPSVQDISDTGGARILYTLDESGQPIRQRVGETFILDVQHPEISFFVYAPLNDFVGNGTITLAISIIGVDDKWSLLDKDLQKLIEEVSLATGYSSEEDIASLLED